MTIKPVVDKSSTNDEGEKNVRERETRISSNQRHKSAGRIAKREKGNSSKFQLNPKVVETCNINKKQQTPSTSSSQNSTISSISSCSNSTEFLGTNDKSLQKSNVSTSSTESNIEFIKKVVEEKVSGYNSGDEYLGNDHGLTNDEWKKRDETFANALLAKKGMIVKEMEEDGNCLFRAMSFQLYGDQEMHDIIRQQTMDYIFQNREYFEQFITEDITNYVNRKRHANDHGNHVEIQAMSEMFNRSVELYCYELKPINIYNSEQLSNGYEPLRLSYHRYSHYNAIIDPYKCSVGVGLGLSNYHPEEFDPTTKQVKEACNVSEQLEIEKMMVEDKLKITDWEATSDMVVEQIARQSYLQYCKDTLKKSNLGKSSTVTSDEACSSSTIDHAGASCSSSRTGHRCESESKENSVATSDFHKTKKSKDSKRHRRSSSRQQYRSNCADQQVHFDSTSSPKRRRVASANSSPSISSSDSDNEKPISMFYQSLLESSYHMNGISQLSETEMIHKALFRSIQDISSKAKNNTDDEYDSP